MKIGILGSGSVARSLGSGLARKGHDVMLGSSDPGKLADVAGVRAAGFAAAAAHGEIVILAVKGIGAAAVVDAAGAALDGKTVIDATNPIAAQPPLHGVLAYFTGPNESLMERLQAARPAARFVKAFNSVGAAHMIDPDFDGGRPTMFIAGNDAAAKAQVAALLDAVGWEVADMGEAVAARAIEPLAILWCIPGIRDNDWAHAFRLLHPRRPA